MTQHQPGRSGTMILGAFGALFDEQGGILCVKRGYGARTWTTPGGMVESGESPLAAVCREFYEETAWKVKVEHLIGVYSVPAKDDHVLFFKVSAIRRDLWVPNTEIVAADFFLLDTLPHPMSLRAAARIADAFAGVKGIVREFETTE